MQNKPSKLLENLIAIGAFDAEKRDQSTSLLDRLFLLMLGQRSCHAMQILSARLRDWEIYQIKLRVEREIERTAATEKRQDREEFFTSLMVSLFETAAIWSGARGGEQSAGPNTGHLLLHILASGSVAGRVLGMYHVMADDVSRDLTSMPAQEEYMSEIRIMRRPAHSPEDDDWEPSPDSPRDSMREPANDQTGGARTYNNKKDKNLISKYGVDLTAAAVRAEIDPVVGRDDEIVRMVQILGRRKKNNPILVGEAGVGKSALVDGLALRIASGNVPKGLLGKRILSLDMAALVAGTKFRGEFEERLKALVDELSKTRDTILFIDEVHTIVGAGSSHGSLDLANILKPALARGDIQVIGATTLDEFRESIEKDAALERRFQKVMVEPASPEATLEILRTIAPHYASHHEVSYTDDALRACVDLTSRYIVDRHLPDKAIDALDEAGSSVSGAGVQVDTSHIEQVITTMTGIPVDRVSQGESQRLCRLEQHLAEAVIGQNEAVGKVARSIVRSRVGLNDPNRPIGVFMFVGPTGVGKTLLAKELSRWMFDRPDALIRIDMSEYGEKHNVARLIGSPPGYVGYGEGGQLTEAVRRQPYAVVLLDEIEKAHPDVFNVMLQMLDEGHLTDGLGRRVDFRNTIIVMTSNAGSRAVSMRTPAVGYATSSSADCEAASIESEYRDALEQTFAPEFINRIDDIVIFNTLAAEDIARVIDLEVDALIARAAALGYTVEVSEPARCELAVLGYDPDYGVRSLKRAITERIEQPLAQMIVAGELSPGQGVDIGYFGDQIELHPAAIARPA